MITSALRWLPWIGAVGVVLAAVGLAGVLNAVLRRPEQLAEVIALPVRPAPEPSRCVCGSHLDLGWPTHTSQVIADGGDPTGHWIVGAWHASAEGARW